MTETSEITEPRSMGMKVVLNNGKLEINSASIPIQWYFDEETIAKNPTGIIIVEQNKYEAEDNRPIVSSIRGERYLSKVSEGVRFIQFLEPGYYRITVYAFKELRYCSNLLGREGKRAYYQSLNTDADTVSRHQIIAFATVEIEVPKELFAKKPETAVGKAVWWWANLLFEKKLRDECHYRKRVLFSFMIQPIVILLCIPLIMLIASAYSIYVFLGSFFCLFFGFRPEPIQTIKDALNDGWFRSNLLKHRSEDNKYRLWKSPEGLRGEKKYMPVTGIEIAAVIVFLYIIPTIALKEIGVEKLRVVDSIILGACVIIALSILFTWLRRSIKYIQKNMINLETRKAIDEEEKRRKEMERELERTRYQKWLHDALLANGVSKPTAYTATERIVQRFYVGYWTLKAKVCKPFAG